MEVTLYSMSISHPARAAGLMLDHKGIDARRVEIPPGSQQLLMRRHGFAHGTVPAIKIDGRRVQGTTAISRALETARPDPPLFPSDPEQRWAVEEAELWGEATYQPVPRRIFRWLLASSADVRTAVARATGMPAPALASHLLVPVAQFYVRFEGGGEDAARRDVSAIPDHLDHVDALIEQGTLNGETLNAADFQIATTTRTLLNFTQLRGFVEGRPAAEHAMRIAPDFGRELPVEIPADWVEGARRGEPTGAGATPLG